MKFTLTIMFMLMCTASFAQQHVTFSQSVSLRLNKISTMSLMIGGSSDISASAAKGNILPNEVSFSSENLGMRARANSALIYSSEPIPESPFVIQGGKGAVVLPDLATFIRRLITVSSR